MAGIKILFSTPLLDIKYEWFCNFIKVWEQLRKMPNITFYYFPQYRVPVQNAQNKEVKEALEIGCDYILHMDDDIWGVPDNAVQMLLDADKDFISALMYANNFPYQMCALVKKPEDKDKSLVDIVKKNVVGLLEAQGEGVVPVDLVAFPFTLWKVSMFKKIPEPWFVYDEGVPTDNYFCQKCLDNGFQPYVHGGVKVTHRGVNHWNRGYRFIGDGQYKISTGEMTDKDPFYKVVMNELERFKTGARE